MSIPLSMDRLQTNLYIPKGYDEDAKEGKAIPSLYDYETARYKTVSSVWFSGNATPNMGDIGFKKSGENRFNYREYEE